MHDPSTLLEALRLLTIVVGFLALVLNVTQILSYYQLMIKQEMFFLLAVILYQAGSVYGSTEAYLRDSPFRPSILLTLAAHVIFVVFGLQATRVIRKFYTSSLTKKAFTSRSDE